MRVSKLAVAIAFVNAAWVATAFAEPGVRQPAQSVAFEYEYYQPTPAAPPAPEATKSPSDAKAAPAPAPAPAAAPAAGNGGCDACNSCNSCNSCDSCHHGGCGCKLCCPDSPPVCRLFDDCCCLKEHCMTLTGYIDTGITWSDNSDKWNGPVGTNDRNNEIQMNQLYVALERATQAGDCDWDLGGRIDLMYGTDARWFESSGLEKTSAGKEKWVTNERFYHLALIQAYGEVAFDDWKVKLGKWNTPMCYEVIDSTVNFFYSRSYMYLYSAPFTQTGLLATKKVDDQLSYSLGFSTGWDNFFDNHDRIDFVGSINMSNCDKSSNLVFTIITGDERVSPDVLTNRTTYDIIFTKKLNDRLAWTIEHMLGVQQDGAANGTQEALWTNIVNYLTYQLNCDWWLGARIEWFEDRDGTRVVPIGDTLTGGWGNAASTGGFAGDFFEYSVGLNYKPVCNPNLVVRPEVRWDTYSGKGHPFDNGTKDDQFTFAVDAVYKF